VAEDVPQGPWNAEPERWHTVSFGDVECPGLATVEVDRENKWDEKKAKGSHGATREYSGAAPAKVRIKIVIWTKDQFDELVAMVMPIIDPVPGKKKLDAIPIGHAIAAARNVSSITVDSVAGPAWSPGGATATVDVAATEYREPETKNATGKAGGGAGRGRSPKDASCQQLANAYDDERNKANRARAERSELVARRNSIQSTATGQNASSLGDISNTAAAQGQINQGEVADLNRQIAEKDGLITVHETNARAIYTTMENQGCTGARPSGSAGATGPT
jgi:hypothetical protein